MKVSFFLVVSARLMISSKVVGLFCLGFTSEAAALGFDLYATRDKHPKSVIREHRSAYSHTEYISAIDMFATDCSFTVWP
jgi:hypothetical protein